MVEEKEIGLQLEMLVLQALTVWDLRQPKVACFQASQGMSAAEANEGSSNMPGSPDDESQM